MNDMLKKTNVIPDDGETAKKRLFPYYLPTVVFLTLGLLLLIPFIIVNNYMFLCASVPLLASAVISFFDRITSDKEGYTLFWCGLIIDAAIVLFVFSCSGLFIVMGVDSYCIWRYPIQKAYLEYLGYSIPECIPDCQNDIRGDYYFRYMPSYSGSSERCNLRFRTDPQTAEEYVKRYSEKALDTFSVNNEKLDICHYYEEYDEDVFVSNLGLHFYEEFWKDCSASTKMYLLERNEEGTYGSTWKFMVLIDPETGKIEFSYNREEQYRNID